MKERKFLETGLVLLEMRKELGLTQAHLALKCKCDSQFVSNWERGLCLPPALEMSRILNAFDKKRATEFKTLLTQSYAEDMCVYIAKRMGWT